MNQDVENVIKLKDNYQLKFMKEAYKEAKKAYDKKEVPVGCVIVKDNKIIARAHNLRETNQNVTNHAETLAISKACKKLKSWRLDDCDVYCTLEPCIMCYGAIVNARIRNLYIATKNKRYDYDALYNITLNHKVNIIEGIYEEESSLLISNFFKELRNNKDE